MWKSSNSSARQDASKNICNLSSLVLVVDAKAAADVEVCELEALLVDLLDEVSHDERCVAEDVHLGRQRKLTNLLVTSEW